MASESHGGQTALSKAHAGPSRRARVATRAATWAFWVAVLGVIGGVASGDANPPPGGPPPTTFGDALVIGLALGAVLFVIFAAIFWFTSSVFWSGPHPPVNGEPVDRTLPALEPTRYIVREHIPQHVKDQVWRRDEGRCARCGSNHRLEFDHIQPVIAGGRNTYRNLQLLCERCNREKGARW